METVNLIVHMLCGLIALLGFAVFSFAAIAFHPMFYVAAIVCLVMAVVVLHTA
jgi:hypothetical protein